MTSNAAAPVVAIDFGRTQALGGIADINRACDSPRLLNLGPLADPKRSFEELRS
jgi:hypothetical protein